MITSARNAHVSLKIRVNDRSNQASSSEQPYIRPNEPWLENTAVNSATVQTVSTEL
jgi:hypothetical protein